MLKLIALLVTISCFSFQPSTPPTDSFKWLLGGWQKQAGKTSRIEEHWTVANDSTLSGISLYINDKKDTIPQETIELAFRKGEWHYIVTVRDQNEGKPVSFKVIFMKGQEFVSENPEHDFPQRIGYRRWKNELFASIEGRRNGAFRKINYDFTRTAE